MFAQHRIHTIPLHDCKEVIDSFKKISNLKKFLHGASFCFAIDKDNKDPSEFEEIRRIDPDFYDESFIVLDRHEVENYLIDKSLILGSLNPILTALGEPIISEERLEGIFQKDASHLKDQSRSKYLASKAKTMAKDLIINPLSNTKNISQNPEANIRAVFSQDLEGLFIDQLNDEKQKFDDQWDQEWERLIDGKAFIGKLLSTLSNISAGVKPAILRRKIVEELVQNPEKYVTGELVKKVCLMINSQSGI